MRRSGGPFTANGTPNGCGWLSGSPPTIDFIDTCRCFHFGSRVRDDGAPRRLLMVDYRTPYAFEFSNHRKEARYRTLAPAASSELQRLLLGGV